MQALLPKLITLLDFPADEVTIGTLKLIDTVLAICPSKHVILLLIMIVAYLFNNTTLVGS